METAFLIFTFMVMFYLCRHEIVSVCKVITADDFKWSNWPVIEQILWILAKIFLIPLGVRSINAPLYYLIYLALTLFLVYRYIEKLPKRAKKTRESDKPESTDESNKSYEHD